MDSTACEPAGRYGRRSSALYLVLPLSNMPQPARSKKPANPERIRVTYFVIVFLHTI
jgi:hypothetical protein